MEYSDFLVVVNAGIKTTTPAVNVTSALNPEAML